MEPLGYFWNPWSMHWSLQLALALVLIIVYCNIGFYINWKSFQIMKNAYLGSDRTFRMNKGLWFAASWTIATSTKNVEYIAAGSSGPVIEAVLKDSDRKLYFYVGPFIWPIKLAWMIAGWVVGIFCWVIDSFKSKKNIVGRFIRLIYNILTWPIRRFLSNPFEDEPKV